MDTLASSDDKSPIFSQAISEAFEPYLSIWVEAQDKYATDALTWWSAADICEGNYQR